ncbi:hypothetical protein ACFL6D_00015 [Spirochaetota bacterium]
MKKKKYIYAITTGFILYIMFGTTSCFGPRVQLHELEIYKKEISKINRRWQIAKSAFFSSETEDVEEEEKELKLYKLNTIELFVLPKFFEIKASLENLNIQDNELEKIHNYYIKTCNDYINFFILVVEYLKSKDESKLELANKSLESAENNLQKYKRLFKRIN